MTLFEKVEASSIGDSALQLLQKKIISGELKAGEWLMPERELAEQMGISSPLSLINTLMNPTVKVCSPQFL